MAGNESLPIKGKGYGGSGRMLQEGAGQLCRLRNLGCLRFIVCHDADGPDPAPRRRLVSEKIVQPSGIRDGCCVVVPVQNWKPGFLRISNVRLTYSPRGGPRPSRILSMSPNPKEHLEKLSRDSKQRPRYSHAVHNERMARHLDLRKVSRKCPALRELEKFVA